MRTVIVDVFLLLIIVCIVNAESASIKKRSISNPQTNLELLDKLRELLNNNEEGLDNMAQRHLKFYARKYMNKKSIFSWDLNERQKACVNKCLPVPDAEFEDCYKKCNTSQ
jgi:hypothetical protein